MNKLRQALSGGSKIIALLVMLLFLIIIVFFIVRMNYSAERDSSTATIDGNNNLSSEDLEEVFADAKPYVPEGADINDPNVVIPESLREAMVTVVGANPIAKNGVVLTSSGTVAKNDSIPMSLEAPRQSPPVDKNNLPASVIKLDVSAEGWSPNEISVKAGMPVTLAVTSTDDQTHLFKFDDTFLSSVAVLVSSGETKVITFNVPSEVGEYAFRCDVPGHASRNEVGKMVIN